MTDETEGQPSDNTKASNLHGARLPPIAIALIVLITVCFGAIAASVIKAFF